MAALGIQQIFSKLFFYIYVLDVHITNMSADWLKYKGLFSATTTSFFAVKYPEFLSNCIEFATQELG
jgi:hypothetical protein